MANEDHDVDVVLRTLKEANQMFATRIVEVNPWYRKIIAPKGKSFFFRLVWMGIAMLAVAAIMAMGIRIMMDEVLLQQLKETLELFTNG